VQQFVKLHRAVFVRCSQQHGAPLLSSVQRSVCPRPTRVCTHVRACVRAGEVFCYSDTDKPPLGQGLNCEAEITLYGVYKVRCWPRPFAHGMRSPRTHLALLPQDHLSCSARTSVRFVTHLEHGEWLCAVRGPFAFALLPHRSSFTCTQLAHAAVPECCTCMLPELASQHAMGVQQSHSSFDARRLPEKHPFAGPLLPGKRARREPRAFVHACPLCPAPLRTLL